MSLSGHNKSELAPAGNKALLSFFKVAAQYPQNFNMSWEQFQQWFATDDNPQYSAIENFGDSVLVVVDRYGWQQVTDKMESIANDSEGRLPAFPDGTANTQEFFSGLTSAVSTVTWRTIKIDAGEVISKTAAEVGTIAKVGLIGTSMFYVAGGALGLFLLIYSARKK